MARSVLNYCHNRCTAVVVVVVDFAAVVVVNYFNSADDGRFSQF